MSRVQLVLENELFAEVERRAKQTGASRSMVVRDLMRLGLEIEEDLMLSRVAETRKKTLKKSKTISHDAVRKKFK